MQRWQGFSRLTLSGQPAPLATITVYNTGTVVPTSIYGSNSLLDAKANPFVSGSDGFGFFYAEAGRYDIQFSGGGITTPWLLSDILLTDQALHLYSGTGSPNGQITAPVGSLYFRTDGGATSTIYVKESGAGNTGWIAK